MTHPADAIADLSRDLTRLVNRATLFMSLVWLILTMAILAYSALEIHGLRRDIQTLCESLVVAAEHGGLDMLKKALKDG